MKNNFKILLPTICFLLFSCEGKEKQSEQIEGFVVELLFEKNGCKMYRFWDGGSRVVYWADCSGKTEYRKVSISGKTNKIIHQESITTE